MLSNATDDVMDAIPVLSKGLHRYDTFEKDSKDQQCQQIWEF